MYDEENLTLQGEKNSTKKWNSLSESVKNLIVAMLSNQPDERPSIEDVLNHKWLSKEFDDELLTDYYDEMVHRKEFIQKYTNRKNKN